jgi:kinesin family protein 5
MGNHLATLSLREGSSWAFTVLEFAGWEERVALTSTNKHIRKQTNNDDQYWRFLCTLLAREHGVYVPPTVPKNLRTWRHLFRELFPMRKMWAPAPAPLIRDNDDDDDDDDDAFANVEVPMPEQGERNKIQVFARFKPKPEKKATDADDAAQAAEASESTDKDEVEVTLPLHQRLAMIRMSHNLTSNRQALKVLTTEGGWFTARWSEIAAKEKKQADAEDNINGGGGGEDEKENAGASGSDGASPNKAAGDAATTKAKKAHVFDAQTDVDSSAAGRRSALPRDFAIRAGKGGDKITASVQSVDPGTGRVVMIAPDVGLREFAFDGVFPARASQQGVYDTVARGLVCDFLNGYNATCVVYGQTGSGKTYSMFGPDDAPPAAAAPTGHPSKGGDVNGIVPRACEEIFAAVKQRRDNYGILAEVGVSFVEVYGDTVSDLLRHGARCGHSKVAAQSFVLSGAAEHPVATMHDVSAALRTGAAQKRRAATAMNDRSSRAHSLFILTLKQHCVKTGTTRTSKLFLADLGGSEQVGVGVGVNVPIRTQRATHPFHRFVGDSSAH